MKFRNLKASEIEVRAAQVQEEGASLLLYKDARVDQRILDETVGEFNWKRSHQLIGDNLYCTVEIYDHEKKEWIAKQDVGTESYTEAEKGQASDSFKRACFNWGIGRELYSAPFIWVSKDKVEIAKNSKGKFYIKSFKPKVESIAYDDDGNISWLRITNRGDEIFSKVCGKIATRKNDKSDDEILAEAKETIETLDDIKSLSNYAKELPKKYVIGKELRAKITAELEKQKARLEK